VYTQQWSVASAIVLRATSRTPIANAVRPRRMSLTVAASETLDAAERTDAIIVALGFTHRSGIVTAGVVRRVARRAHAVHARPVATIFPHIDATLDAPRDFFRDAYVGIFRARRGGRDAFTVFTFCTAGVVGRVANQASVTYTHQVRIRARRVGAALGAVSNRLVRNADEPALAVVSVRVARHETLFVDALPLIRWA